VRFSELPAETPKSSLALIGSTNRFSCFYNLENKQTLVVPQENIALIKKNLVQLKPNPKLLALACKAVVNSENLKT